MKQPILYQRIEAAFIFLASLIVYLHLGYKWYWFVIFLFTVDISMIGYITKNSKIGALGYNLGHSFSLPIILLVAGIFSSSSILIGGSLIWLAHIGFDRALGYGLKLNSGFQDTHLGKVGNK